MLIFLLTVAAVTQVQAAENPDCQKWESYCNSDNAWMKENCKETCAGHQSKDSCETWSSYCDKKNPWMDQHCKATCSNRNKQKKQICYSTDFVDPAADPNLIMEEKGAGYAIKKLQNNVWGIMAGDYNSLLVTGTNHTLLIDAGHGNADAILKGVKSVLGTGELTHFLYGHVHHDHVGGADKVKAAYPNVKLIASTKTNEELIVLKSPSRPLADIVLTDLAKGLQVGGVDYQFIPLVSHGADNMIVMVDGKTAFAADVINPGSAPFLNFVFTNNFNLNLFKKDVQTLKDLKWEVFMPGHINRLGTREDLQVVLDYTDAVIQAIGKAMGTVQYRDAVMKAGLSQANAMGFAGYRIFYEEVSKACETDLTAQWKKGDQSWKQTTLRNVDALAFSHCWAAAWYFHMFAPGR